MSVVESQSELEKHRYYYGHENRLIETVESYSGSSTNYYYDPAGNRIAKVTPTATTQYEYDERNLLTRLVTTTEDIKFEYDALGNRVAKSVNGVRTEYLVDSVSSIPQVLEESTGGVQSASYIYGAGGRLGIYNPQDGATDYFLADSLGSVRQMIDETGAATSEYQYDVFGVLTSGPSASGEYLFTGERVDVETGLVYLRARYFDPETGTFITKDPLGLRAGLNSFVYVSNNPVNFVDSLGLEEEFLGEDLARLYLEHFGNNGAKAWIYARMLRNQRRGEILIGSWDEALRNAEHYLYSYQEVTRDKYNWIGQVPFTIGYDALKLSTNAVDFYTMKMSGSHFGSWWGTRPTIDSLKSGIMGATDALDDSKKANEGKCEE